MEAAKLYREIRGDQEDQMITVEKYSRNISSGSAHRICGPVGNKAASHAGSSTR